MRVAPDKIRTAAVLVRAKKIPDALNILKFSNQAAAKPLTLALKSALALAKDQALTEDDLRILRILVDEGPKLKRRRIIHQGRATAILKRMAHITVTLTSDGNSKSEARLQALNPKQKINNQNPKIKK